MDQIDGRVHDPTGDQEQDCPYQKINLSPQFGGGLLHHLRPPEEHGFQK
jgi:hypothetical protein